MPQICDTLQSKITHIHHAYTYIRGKEANIFNKRDVIPYLRKVWPGDVYYPNFAHPESEKYDLPRKSEHACVRFIICLSNCAVETKIKDIGVFYL